MLNKSRRIYLLVIPVLLLLILLMACDCPDCEPVPPTEVVNTDVPPTLLPTIPPPTDVPTDWPTPETNVTLTPDMTWDQSCLFETAEKFNNGVQINPYNENACLTGQCIEYPYDRPICFPEMYSLEVIPHDIETGGLGALPKIYRTSTGVLMEVYNFDGHIIVEIHGLELMANICYSVNIIMDVQFEGSQANYIENNYSLTGRIFDTSGNSLTLGTVSFLDWTDSSHALMSGQRNRWFNFTPTTSKTAYLQLDFWINHAMSVGGSVEYQSIWVTRNLNAGNCAGMGF